MLAHTYEYRHPPKEKLREAAAQAVKAAASGPSASTNSLLIDMTSRYLGLVVVPGKYIVRIEVEEFTSQLKRVPLPMLPTVA